MLMFCALVTIFAIANNLIERWLHRQELKHKNFLIAHYAQRSNLCFEQAIILYAKYHEIDLDVNEIKAIKKKIEDDVEAEVLISIAISKNKKHEKNSSGRR